MREIIFSVLLALIVFSSKGEVRGQESLPKDNSCQPSAEEILFLVKSTYNLVPNAEGVIVAGEVYLTTNISLKEEPNLSLQPYKPLWTAQLVAMVGGFSKNAEHPFYLIRESSEEKTKIKQEIDLREIKAGRAKDVQVEKGDVIFVGRGCSDGRLLPTKKRKEQKAKGGLTDSPIPVKMKNPNRKS